MTDPVRILNLPVFTLLTTFSGGSVKNYTTCVKAQFFTVKRHFDYTYHLLLELPLNNLQSVKKY